MRTFAYLEQCREMHAQISEGEFILGSLVERGSGGSFDFRSLGKVLLDNGKTLYIGEKSPRNGDSHETMWRVTQELGVFSIIADRCPDIMPLLPSFTGWRSLKGVRTNITEDASAGGTISVQSRPASSFVQDQFRNGFSEFGIFEEVFDGEVLQSSLAFKAGNSERLLDITPSPYKSSTQTIRNRYRIDLLRDAQRIAEELEFKFPQVEY